MSSTNFDDIFIVIELLFSACVIGGIEERGVKNCEWQNQKNKTKLNLTVREEQRNKLEQMASLGRLIAKRGRATRNH